LIRARAICTISWRPCSAWPAGVARGGGIFADEYIYDGTKQIEQGGDGPPVDDDESVGEDWYARRDEAEQ
jgi:hypothetical protein